MSNTLRQILFYLVVFLGNIIQCITGFAGTVLAMPFSMMLVGVDTAKFVLNILGILASIGVVIFNFKSIKWKEFLKIVLVMLPGMAGGFAILNFTNVSDSKGVLYLILAGVVLAFVAIGIYETFIKKSEPKDNIWYHILMMIILLSAGVVHGMFVCGGPLLIIYAARKLPNKDEFRATLSMAWIVLNSLILGFDLYEGTYSAITIANPIHILGICAITLVGSILIGNLIAKKLNKNIFMIITYSLMGISAVSLIINAIGAF